MSEQANERIIRSLCDAFGRGDVQTILDMLADDVSEWHREQEPEL